VLDVAEHLPSVRYFSPLCYDFRNQGIKSEFSEGVKQKASKAICVTHTSGKKIDTEKSGPPGAGHINIYLIVFIDINFDN
jgi:hypothetical protein